MHKERVGNTGMSIRLALSYLGGLTAVAVGIGVLGIFTLISMNDDHIAYLPILSGIICIVSGILLIRWSAKRIGNSAWDTFLDLLLFFI